MKTLKNILVWSGTLVGVYLCFAQNQQEGYDLILYFAGVVTGVGFGLPTRVLRNLV